MKIFNSAFWTEFKEDQNNFFLADIKVNTRDALSLEYIINPKRIISFRTNAIYGRKY